MAEFLFETDKQLQVIDCRALVPPEPMERILESVETLGKDQAILMIHHKIPRLLYAKLEERHCDSETKTLEDGSVKVLIWKRDLENK
jgi:uncharacterized protein (DUF2249 family)